MFKKFLEIARINREIKENDKQWKEIIENSNKVIENFGVDDLDELPVVIQGLLDILLDRAIELEVRNFELSIQKENL